jgi:hypothetical protein
MMCMLYHSEYNLILMQEHTMKSETMCSDWTHVPWQLLLYMSLCTYTLLTPFTKPWVRRFNSRKHNARCSWCTLHVEAMWDVLKTKTNRSESHTNSHHALHILFIPTQCVAIHSVWQLFWRHLVVLHNWFNDVVCCLQQCIWSVTAWVDFTQKWIHHHDAV